MHCVSAVVRAVASSLVGSYRRDILAPRIYADPRTSGIGHRRVEHFVDSFETQKAGKLLEFCSSMLSCERHVVLRSVDFRSIRKSAGVEELLHSDRKNMLLRTAPVHRLVREKEVH
jgi:hypothetical protein